MGYCFSPLLKAISRSILLLFLLFSLSIKPGKHKHSTDDDLHQMFIDTTRLNNLGMLWINGHLQKVFNRGDGRSELPFEALLYYPRFAYIVPRFIKDGAEVEIGIQQTPLAIAVQYNTAATVALLLSHGARTTKVIELEKDSKIEKTSVLVLAQQRLTEAQTYLAQRPKSKRRQQEVQEAQQVFDLVK